jgi:hypothetical protein
LIIGVNLTVKWTLAPGRILTGRVKLPNVKADPLIDLEDIFRATLPVLVSLNENVLELPT